MKRYHDFEKSDYPEYNSYVYWVSDIKTHKHYIGSRKSSCCDLEYDLQKYKTSSKIVKYIFENRKEDLRLTILRVFKTHEEAYNYEIFLHKYFNVDLNNNFYNKSIQTTKKFTTSGIKRIYNKKTREFEVINLSDFDETKHEKIVTCLNKMTNKFEQIPVSKYNNENYMTFFQKDHLYVKLKDSNEYFLIKKEDYNPKIHIRNTSGYVVVKDKNNLNSGNFLVSIDEFKNNENLISVSKNTVITRNKETGETKRINCEDYDPKFYDLPSTNVVYCLDKETNKKVAISREEFKNNREKYELYMTTLKCYNKETKEIKYVKKSEIEKNPELYILHINEKVLVKGSPNYYVSNLEYQLNKEKYNIILKNNIHVLDIIDNKFISVNKEEFRKHKERYILKSKIIQKEKNNG